MKHYLAIFEPQKEGGYTVTFPDVPNAITEGDTFDDAFENAIEVLSLVLETDSHLGWDIPESKAKADRLASKAKKGSLFVKIPLAPVHGKPKTYSVSIDENLMRAVDEYAVATNRTRSDVLATGAAFLMQHRPIRRVGEGTRKR